MITHGRGYLFGLKDTKQYKVMTDRKDQTLKVAEDGEDYV